MKIVKDTYPLLEPFQKTGVDFLSKARSALLADDVGTGKTAQGIHACQYVGALSILVICTASIKYNWKKEAIKWGYDERDIHILDDQNVQTMPERGMFILNYDLCWRKQYARVLFRRKFDVLICDEAHYLKNHTSKRAKSVWLRNGYADISVYRWMITATPLLNRPVELHAMLKKLCPERLGGYVNYIAFTRRYCDGKDGKWGYEALGAENLEELAGRLDGFMLRRTLDETMGDLTLQKIYLPFSKEIEKYLYTGEENESIRRKIGCGKIEPSVEIIANILESEEKIVVFAYHTDVILGLEKNLADYNPVVLRGATPSGKRQETIDRFQKDPECRVFIGQVQAAGEGIDGLQHAARMGVFVETNCPPGTVKQAIGRLYRKGQKHSCLFQFLLVEGTVDEEILNQTLFKDENIRQVMKDEKKGLDFSNPKTKKEEGMNIEASLDRIATALEALVTLKQEDTQTVTEVTVAAPTAIPVQAPQLARATGGTGPTGAIKPKPKPKPRVKPKAKVTGPTGLTGTAGVGGTATPTNPTGTAPAPIVPGVIPTTPEDYQTRMNGIANLISTFSGDPAKTNAIFARLQAKFKVQYPNNEHVFDVQPANYAAVCALVDAFLKEEKIQ